MSGDREDAGTQPAADPAAEQALPADAGAATGGDVAPDAATRVEAVPPPAGAQSPPAGAQTGGPSGTGVGTPGGLPAGLMEKLPVDAELLERKPELLVGGAFVGGFLVAKVLRRIAGV